MQKLKNNLSRLINEENIRLDQSRSFILFVRMWQLLQYLAITVQEIDQMNHKKDEHFRIIFQILRLSILDMNFLPDYIGYITTFVNFIVFVLLILSLSYFDRTSKILMPILIGYIALLPQITCFLFVSSTFKSFLLNEETNYILQIWAIFDVTLTFSISLLSCFLLRNIYFNQSTFTRDQSLLKIISQIFQFATQIFYFYQAREGILVLKWFSALLWIGLEQIDIYLYMPYSLHDNNLIFTLNQIKFGCNLVNFILNSISDSVEKTSSQFIYYFIFASISYYLGNTLFQRLFYSKGLDIFSKSSELDQNLQIKVLKQFIIQGRTQLTQTDKLLEVGMINQHVLHCQQGCKSQDVQDVMKCIVNYQGQHKEEEHLFLYKITYLAFENKQYSKSLARLKHYQIKFKSTLSWFFNLIQIEISSRLTKEIFRQQSEKRLNSDTSFVNFSSEDLVHIEVQSNILIPIIRKTLQAKLEVWKKQLKGFDTIKILQDELCKLANELEILRKQFKLIINRDVYEVNISQINNLYHLRMLSLYYSIIMNDQLHSFLCEKQYYLLYSYEQTLQQDQLNSIALVLDKVSIVTVSLVKSLGTILNGNKQQLGHMFHYKKVEEFSNIMHLNQLMPDFIAVQHDSWLQNFLQVGDSPFFQQFRMIFGKTRENYIFPLYLKLANDFSYEEDYVIKGIFFSGVKRHDYILFDKNGRIQGITKQVYHDLFLENNEEDQIDLDFVYNYCFLYYFVPDLFEIIKRFNIRQKDQNENINFQEDVIFVTYDDIRSFHDRFQQHMKNFTSNIFCIWNLAKKQSLRQRQSTISNQHKGRNQPESILEINLLNDDYSKQAQEFINQNVAQQKTCFVRFALWFQKSSQNDGFYIMQIQDYRKHDFGELATELFAMHDADSTMRRSTLRHLKDLILSKRRYGDLQTFQNIYQKRLQYSKQMASFNQTDLFTTQPNINTSNQTPKALFIKPEIALNSEMESVQEVKNSSSEESQFLDDFLSDESRKQTQKQDKKVQSFSRTNNISDADQNHNKSQNSSAVSRISTNQSYFFQIVFKQKASLSKTIIILWIMVTTVNLISLGGLGFTDYQIIYNDQKLLDDSSSFMGPLKFNRYFCKTLALSWLFILNKYSVINTSEYQNKQNLYQMNLLDQFVFNNFTELYPIFIHMESQGILQNLTIEYFTGTETQVEFTRLFNYFEDILFHLYQIDHYDEYTYLQYISKQFIEETLIIKYNLAEIFKINGNLMNEFNSISTTRQQLGNSVFVIEHLVHTVIFFLIMITQLIQWNRIEQQNRNLALLIGRIKDSEVEHEIQRAYIVFTALNIQAGEESWKRYNYFNFGFQLETQMYQNKSKLIVSQKFGNTSQSHQKNFKTLNTKINFFTHWIKILIFIIIYELYLWGGYSIYMTQSNEIEPLQSINTVFAQFSTKIDIITCSALIIKTQPILYHKWEENNIFKINELKVNNDMLSSFIDLYEDIQKSFAYLYLQVITDFSINQQITEAQGLLSSDICQYLKNDLPFCQLNNIISETDFINLYGEYNQIDDNSDFLSNGILGMITKMQQFFQQNYASEIQNETYYTNDQETLTLLNSHDFSAIIISHFRDTYICFVRFLELLQDKINILRQDHLLIILWYYNAIAIIYIICFQVYYSIWIKQNIRVMRQIKLSLIAIPHFQITSDPVINILKRYQ